MVKKSLSQHKVLGHGLQVRSCIILALYNADKPLLHIQMKYPHKVAVNLNIADDGWE